MNQNEANKRIYSILRNVAEDYIVLIDVNLVTEKEIQFPLQSGKLPLPKWSKADDYSTCIVDYAKKFIIQEDQQRFIESTKIDNMKKIFQKQKEFIIEYNTNINGNLRHFQGRFVLNKEESDPHMFIGIRDITETKKYEEMSKEMTEYQHYKSIISDKVIDKRTILIVEDNELNREILNSFLSPNFNIIEAENGLIGYNILQKEYQKISLILLDVQMPIINGYEFLKITQKGPILKMIPVIVTTGNNNQNEEEKCLNLGTSDFVSKPYNPNIILSRINSIIKLRESAATLAAVEFDELTGIYTRQAFYHHAQLLLKQNPDINYTLTICDVEDFKRINELYGKDTGDAILNVIAKYLKQTGEKGYLVGRLGPDQFVVLTKFKNKKVLEEANEEILNSMPISSVILKYGVYSPVNPDIDIAVSCDKALIALQNVKHKFNQNIGYYTYDIQKKEERERQIEMDMQNAYHQEQFKVYYQPKHDALTGKIMGAEALIRWIHPTYGFMSPGEFIPLFERNGFISWADYFVLRKTCQNIRKWKDKGLEMVPISVNASRLDFNREDLMDRINDCIKTYNLQPESLHIEVTESLFANNMDQIKAILTTCQEQGFKVELDDFGSGYSSLNALADLPIDIVKLDMSFAKQIHNAKRNRVLSSCIQLAQSLQLETIIEGIETEEQLDIVQRFGVDAIQGYYYSKPLPEDEFEEYFKKCFEKERDEHPRIVLNPTSPIGFIIYKMDFNSTLLYANKEALNIWKCNTIEEFIDLCDKKYLNTIYKDDQKGIFSEKRHQLNEDREYLSNHYRIIDKEGNLKWIDEVSHKIQDEKYGECFYGFVKEC